MSRVDACNINIDTLIDRATLCKEFEAFKEDVIKGLRQKFNTEEVPQNANLDEYDSSKIYQEILDRFYGGEVYSLASKNYYYKDSIKHDLKFFIDNGDLLTVILFVINYYIKVKINKSESLREFLFYLSNENDNSTCSYFDIIIDDTEKVLIRHIDSEIVVINDLSGKSAKEIEQEVKASLNDIQKFIENEIAIERS